MLQAEAVEQAYNFREIQHLLWLLAVVVEHILLHQDKQEQVADLLGKMQEHLELVDSAALKALRVRVVMVVAE